MVTKEIRTKIKRKLRRTARIRNKIRAQKVYPRLTVFRSNSHFYAQIIDDNNGVTLAAASDAKIEEKGLNKSLRAIKVGELIAKQAQEKKIEKVVFDKGSYRYHGRVKSFADAARTGGLQF